MSDILSARDSMSFLTEATPRGSPLIDKISTESNIFNRDGMSILRNDNSLGNNLTDDISFKAGDRVVLRTQMDELISLKRVMTLEWLIH